MSTAVIAVYEVGYDIAAFGVSPLRHAGLDLPAAFVVAAVVAVALAAGAWPVSRRSAPTSS